MNARTLAASVLACLAGGAQAQALPDPTRPPPQFAGAGVATGAASAAAAVPLLLQSILIDRAAGGRRLAVIDGVTVVPGGVVGGATVVRIGANDVEVRKDGRRQLLRLFPRSVMAAAVAAPPVDLQPHPK
ncbi:MSHA biogenesis protein MshK [Massilia sp. PWRC2]|uniref:MSHA biogenesis protein MshK n=1 Tax=Massilia sp. PWRC2 TaxID=2804626 RepID=UPI003CE7EF80